MNDLHRLREILPFAAILYLLTSLGQLYATQRPAHPIAAPAISAERVVSALRWHMLQIARSERDEALLLYPGN